MAADCYIVPKVSLPGRLMHMAARVSLSLSRSLQQSRAVLRSMPLVRCLLLQRELRWMS